MLPSAAAFVDPLLSTGFPLTLLGVARLAKIMERDPGTERLPDCLAAYASRTMAEADATARLIAALYSRMADFELFTNLSLLYFAAASFTESARRLGRADELSFLLHDHSKFGVGLRECCGRAESGGRQGLIKLIRRIIEPINVADVWRDGLSANPV